MCQERSAGAAQHRQGTDVRRRRGRKHSSPSLAAPCWGLWPQLRDDPKVMMEATPEPPETPGASSWSSAEQEMWLLCRAGLASRMHKGKDLTQNPNPPPLPLAPTQTLPILQHFPANHPNLRRAPAGIRNRQLNCLVARGNASRFFFPASELYLFI